jgi:hypothetical protein
VVVWKVDEGLENPRNYEQMPCYPAEQVLKQLLKDFYELNYVLLPEGHFILNYRPSNKRYDHKFKNYVEFTISEAEMIAFANEPIQDKDSIGFEVESRKRDELNVVRAFKYIYQRNGWPNEFNGDRCLADLEEFERKMEEIRTRISGVNLFPMHGLIPEELPLRKEFEMFLIEAAGPLAIKPPGG